MLADAECIHLAAAVFNSLGMDVVIRVNNRKVLDAVCNKLHIKHANDVIITIDKLEKIGKEGVKKELTAKGLSEDQQEKLLALLLIQGTNAGKIKFLTEELGEEALAEVKELFSYIHTAVEFTPSLARGLAYYTGTVYEAFAVDSAVRSSLMGGGRYDQLIGVLTKGQSQPAVGISFGIEPIGEVLKEQKTEADDSETQVFLIPIGDTQKKCVSFLQELRENNVSCSMDLNGRNITKNIEYASKLRIPYVLIVGEKDLEHGVLTLKDLKSGVEKKIKVTELGDLKVEL
jgi:histidyl-tRNA synthetase